MDCNKTDYQVNSFVSTRVERWLEETGTTKRQLCEATGMTPARLKRRLDGETEWRYSEVRALMGATGRDASYFLPANR